MILEPVPEDWAWLDAIVGPLDDDFVAAFNEESEPHDRPGLDDC